jgi:outer membrane protein assembly factor BamE (lipoprotein component of BamABCDE complex)
MLNATDTANKVVKCTQFVSLALIFALFLGCTSAQKNMNRLSIGMSKSEVIDVMGHPLSTSANQSTEYMIYRSANAGQGWYGRHFVRIVDGKVDAFGRQGDFDSTKDPTLNMNITKKDEVGN